MVGKVNAWWIVDSGATRHITSVRSSLKNYKEEATTVMLEDDSTVNALGEGDAHFALASPGRPGMVLCKVLYAPDMAANLFSVRAVMSKGGSVAFEDGKCTVSLRGQTVITAHPVPNGQYALDSTPSVGAVAAVAMEEASGDAQLRHRRFGHLGLVNVRRVIKMVSGMNLKAEQVETAAGSVCGPCV